MKHHSYFTWKDTWRRGSRNGNGNAHTPTSTVLPTAAPTTWVASSTTPTAAEEIRATKTEYICMYVLKYTYM